MKIRKAPIKRPQFNKDSIHRVRLRRGQVLRQVLLRYRQGTRSGEKCALRSILLSDVFKSKHQSHHYLWIYSLMLNWVYYQPGSPFCLQGENEREEGQRHGR